MVGNHNQNNVHFCWLSKKKTSPSSELWQSHKERFPFSEIGPIRFVLHYTYNNNQREKWLSFYKPKIEFELFTYFFQV